MKIVDHREKDSRLVLISSRRRGDHVEGPRGVIWEVGYSRGQRRQVFEVTTGKTCEVEQDTIVVPLIVSLHIDGEGVE